jgi:hypothetical protein
VQIQFLIVFRRRNLDIISSSSVIGRELSLLYQLPGNTRKKCVTLTGTVHEWGRYGRIRKNLDALLVTMTGLVLSNSAFLVSCTRVPRRAPRSVLRCFTVTADKGSGSSRDLYAPPRHGTACTGNPDPARPAARSSSRKGTSPRAFRFVASREGSLAQIYHPIRGH